MDRSAIGAQLLDQTCTVLDQFLVLPSHAWRDTIAAYVLATHVRDAEQWCAFDYSPRLAFLSEGPASGKTLALEITSALSFNGEMLSDPSAYGLLDSITENLSTPAIDEIDVWWGRGAGSRTTRTVLNDGYKPGKTLRRSRKQLRFNSFVILAGMGANFLTNHDLRALRSRTLICPMRPKPDGTHREKYRARMYGADLQALATAMSEWGRVSSRELAAAWPEVPDGVANRAEEIWTPLLAIGEACGPEWAHRLRAACVAIETADEPEQQITTPLDRLLEDLARVFADAGCPDELTTLSLIDGLRALPGGWGQGVKDRAAAMKLSAMLGLLRSDDGAPVGPRKEWRDGRHVQVYLLADLDKHFAAHVPWWSDRPAESSDAWDDDVALG